MRLQVLCVCCRAEAAYNQALQQLGVGLDAEPGAIHALLAPEFPLLTRQVSSQLWSLISWFQWAFSPG